MTGIKKNEKERSMYLVYLLIIGALLSLFCFLYLRNYAAASQVEQGYEEFPFYGQHYYEYYMRSVILWDSLNHLNFSEFFHYYATSYSNKIILLRPLPFFLIFGPSQFVFVYSNLFFNFFLLIMVYISMTGIFRPKKAFLFSLFLLSNFTDLALFLSPYVDLTMMLACSLFFIFMYRFHLNYRKNMAGLAISIFLIFLTKNLAYAFVSFFSFFFVVYMVAARRKEWLVYCLRYTAAAAVGFILYLMLAMTPDLFGKGGELFVFSQVLETFSSHLSFTDIGSFFIPRLIWFFYEPWLSLLAFASLAYLVLRKKERYWTYMFLVSHLFLLLLLVWLFSYGFQLRFITPLYFSYMIIIFQGAYSFITGIIRSRRPDLLVSLLILILFLSNLFILSRADGFDRITFSDAQEMTRYANEKIFYGLPAHSEIHVAGSRESCIFYDWSSDLHGYSNFFSLEIIDPRFGYSIVINDGDDFGSADYILYSDCRDISLPGFRLSGTYDVSGISGSPGQKLYLLERMEED
ncbi:hypothetical protein JXC34_07465 [Candidatus Woesearchaeota archaeon]|nr:hypothetical protein [Candidatus Woesearchaeota archaeon]